MDFITRKAVSADLPSIMQIMEAANKNIARKDWFVSDSEEYVKKHINDLGFTVIAENDAKEAVGFFLIKFPGISHENLGFLLGFSDEMLENTVHMDMTAVLPDFRGHRLQERMLQEAEHILKSGYPQYHYLMATVHPDNCYSLNNMLKNGYDIVLTTELYGGLPRHVLLKRNGI